MTRREVKEKELRELSPFYSDAKIGEMLGWSAEYIRKKRIKYGITPGKRRSFDPDREVLESLYQKMSMRDIARKFGVGETVVWKRLKEHGITLRGYETGGHRRKPGRRFSDEHLANLRAASKRNRGKYAGENSPSWKGGVSGTSAADRRTAAHREWKQAVIDRAGGKCEECGAVHGKICDCCGLKMTLHVHHIRPYKEYPKLRYDPENGAALCPPCHRKQHF